LSARRSFNLTVNNSNRPPSLDPIGDRSVDEGATLSFVITASNPDGDDDPRDLDGDGTITANDARQLSLLCTRPRCATE